MAPVRLLRGLLIGTGIAIVATVFLNSVLLGIVVGLLSAIAAAFLLKSGDPSREIERSQLKMLMVVFIILGIAAAGLIFAMFL